MIRGLQFLLLLFAPALALAADVSPLQLLKTGRADDAISALNARIQAEPRDAQAWNLLCRVYFQLELWDEAVRAGEKSIQLDPQNSEYHQWLGRAYGEKAETIGPLGAFALVRKVKAEFEKSVALDAEARNLQARADLAEFYTEAPAIMGGDKTKAGKLAEFVMKYDAALGHAMLAHLANERNAKERAEQEYKAAIEASGNSSRYWVGLASFYRRAGRYQEMEAAINSALKAPVQDAIALFDGASVLLRGGRNFPGAIDMFQRYLTLDDRAEDGPAFQAHYRLGVLLEKQGDREAAAAEFRSAVALASRYRPARDALARISR